MKAFILILSLFLLFINNSYSQNPWIVEDYSPFKEDVIDAGSVVYFGLDFSKMVLTNPEKFGEDQELLKYFPAWITYFHQELDPNNHIKRWLRKGDNFEFEYSDVQDRVMLVPQTWIKFNRNSFNIDTLQQVINSYQLKKKEGLGFVINIENFNKSEVYVTAYFTFFDIKSRKILWATKVRATPDAWGMTGYWGSGIRIATKIYFDKVYFKSVKKHKKYK